MLFAVNAIGTFPVTVQPCTSEYMPTMLILGARSDIARATALIFARNGWDIILAGRDLPALEKSATDIAIRTTRTVTTSFFDALSPQSHEAFWQQHSAASDAVFCAVGLMLEQKNAENDFACAEQILQTNFTGLVPILSMAANTFEERGNGLIIGVSSVAGDRGRASNYVYGSAKAGFTAFLSGLRNRLAKKGVHVMTVKPGFVATSMTEGMKLPASLTASADQVAEDILRGVVKKRDIMYTRWFWFWIMFIIKNIPERVFKKLYL